MLEAFFAGFAAEAYGWIGAFDSAVSWLPVSYAFGAGMLASVNPCGFVMLPAFAAFFFSAGDADADPGTSTRLVRALVMGLALAVAFIATFALVGTAISFLGVGLTRFLGPATIVIGAGLVALGVYQAVSGRWLSVPVRISVSRRATVVGVLAFGVAYAVASVSCTLPIFLTVVAGAFAADGGIAGPVRGFVEYAGGMAVVAVAVAFAVAMLRGQTLRIADRATRYVERLGSVFLIFAGAYLMWYWSQGLVSL